ncbi:MAG: tetratricopeptide repeat protein [Candidatus Doudnabacteria bacterium]|nr:tetratricopeptide repeat protein [Candidatus Doudnabacteria bacterium]
MSEINRGKVLEFKVPGKRGEENIPRQENKGLGYYIDYAQKAYAAGDYKTAISALYACLELTDEDFDIKLMLGDCYFELNDFDEGSKIYEELLKEQPRNFEVVYRLGREYLLEGLDEAAVEKFRVALDIDPHSQEAMFYLGETLAGLGNHAEAIGYLNKITSASLKTKAQGILKDLIESSDLKIIRKANEELS